jgi:hypothetical protein
MFSRLITGQARTAGLTVAVTVALAVAAAEAQGQDGGRAAPPGEATRTQIEQQVRQALAPKYEDSSAEGPRALVAALMELGTDQTSPFDMRYVLLDEARSVALRAELLDETLAAITALDEGWRVDGFTWRVETLETLSRRLREPAVVAAWVEAALGVIGEAMDRDDAVTASQLLATAGGAVGRVSDPVAVKALRQRLDALSDALRQQRTYQLHRARLDRNGDDPVANTAVGKHVCLVRNDWLTGLRMLAKGNDAALRELAQTELKPEKTVDEMLKLAEGWLAQARTEHGLLADPMARRVVHWCSQAEPHSTGLRLVAVQQRRDEAYKFIEPPTGLALPPHQAFLHYSFAPETVFESDGQKRIRDLSGRDHHGVVHGGEPAPGLFGTAIRLGGGSHVQMPQLRDVIANDRSELSVAVILQCDDPRRAQWVFDVGFYGGDSLTLRTNSNGAFCWNMRNGEIASPQATDNAWHMVVVTWEKGQGRLYIDGEMVASDQVGPPLLSDSTVGGYMARLGLMAKRDGRARARSFRGRIDEFAMYGRVLSGGEIEAICRRVEARVP